MKFYECIYIFLYNVFWFDIFLLIWHISTLLSKHNCYLFFLINNHHRFFSKRKHQHRHQPQRNQPLWGDGKILVWESDRSLVVWNGHGPIKDDISCWWFRNPARRQTTVWTSWDIFFTYINWSRISEPSTGYQGKPMVNKPLIRPYFWGGVALGGAARIPLRISLLSRLRARRFLEDGLPVRLGRAVRNKNQWFDPLRVP